MLGGNGRRRAAAHRRLRRPAAARRPAASRDGALAGLHRFLAFTPDGKTLVTGEMNGPEVIRFWDATTGKETGTCHPASSVSALALSPDGKTLAIDASRQSTGVVLFLSVPDGKENRRIEATATAPGAGLYYNRLEFSRDGKDLATVRQ